MRKFGIGTMLALAGCVAVGAGAFALVVRGDGSDAAVNQVADTPEGTGEDDGDGDRDGGFEHYGPPPGPFPGGPGIMHFRGRPDFGGRARFRPPSSEDILKRRREFAKDLASELDKSADEVEDALRGVFKKHIDEAVADEDLTQKQADRILKCYDTAKCGPGPRPFEP
jgi:hypothetical protein